MWPGAGCGQRTHGCHGRVCMGQQAERQDAPRQVAAALATAQMPNNNGANPHHQQALRQMGRRTSSTSPPICSSPIVISAGRHVPQPSEVRQGHHRHAHNDANSCGLPGTTQDCCSNAATGVHLGPCGSKSPRYTAALRDRSCARGSRNKSNGRAHQTLPGHSLPPARCWCG